MTYLSICKDYKKISLFFTLGMVAAFLLAALLIRVFHKTVVYSMLAALDVGFLLTACLEMAVVRSYFRETSGHYGEVLSYFKKYWQLVVINLLYTLGLYVHNFVFWTTEYRMVVAESFVSMQAYDMATCIAMFTNISATAIFTSRVEMHFHERYKAYSEAVIGGRRMDIESARARMFSQLSQELMNLARIQFIISVIVFLLCCVFLPQFGFGGMVMRIYPCLAAGYFILFIVYSAILFLYYFNDLQGALYTTLAFTSIIFLGSITATHLPQIWFGIGVVAGAFAGWCVAYSRLRWVERNIDVHVFCQGSILKRGKGKRPSSRVYCRYEDSEQNKRDEKKNQKKKGEKQDQKKEKRKEKEALERNEGQEKKKQQAKKGGQVKVEERAGKEPQKEKERKKPAGQPAEERKEKAGKPAEERKEKAGQPAEERKEKAGQPAEEQKEKAGQPAEKEQKKTKDKKVKDKKAKDRKTRDKSTKELEELEDLVDLDLE